MNRIIAVIGVIAAVLLLSPYLGINFFGGSSESNESVSEPVTEKVSSEAPTPVTHETVKRKQPMVEDILSHPAEGHSPASSQKLSDIERLLNNNGENK